MSGNSIGKKFCLTTFGESHGIAIGGVIDGCPPGLEIDLPFIQSELDRRKPGQSEITSPRKESDTVEILSGIYNGKTTGTPIGFIIRNNDQRSQDYDNLKDIFRPSSADFTYFSKYGTRDYRGGGRSSARETAARVVAGAVAKLILQKEGIDVIAYTSQIGNISINYELGIRNYELISKENIEKSIVRCPDEKVSGEMIDYIKMLRDENDSIGGIVSCVIKGLPAGLGEPVFDKMSSELARAMLSINAAKGFDYGSGFEGVTRKGSELNDLFISQKSKIDTSIKYQVSRQESLAISTLTNNSGGIQGGITNGEDIYFRVVFKPASSIAKKQKTIDIRGNETEIEIKGRHDPCIVPRAVPVVEAMSAITIVDFLLRG